MKLDKNKITNFLFDNKVTILFVLLCLGGIIASKQPMTFVATELFTRIGRNTFIVLALIIPVLAGMGLNFSIVIGAIAAQIAIFIVAYFDLQGMQGFLISVAITTPLAAFFGYLVGQLFNRMKGSEMIGGMILGYFADGLYQLLFLFIIGGIIPVNNPKLIISSGVGVKNTIDLKDNIKYALDKQPLLPIVEFILLAIVVVSVGILLFNLIKKKELNLKKYLTLIIGSAVAYALTYVPFIYDLLCMTEMTLLAALEFGLALIVVVALAKIIMGFIKKDKQCWKKHAIIIACAGVIYALTYIPEVLKVLLAVRVPALTYALIAILCMFNTLLMKTKLGQNIRTVGQSMVVANAAGINVDKTRITAMILSTMLAGYGQLILLQNIGTFQTYGAHTQVGQFAIAALLVGGASVHMASNKQAVLGVILFHTLFIVAPIAGKELFGNAQIGEYFRVFVAYGVIAVALAMYAWKTVIKPKTLSDDKPKK